MKWSEVPSMLAQLYDQFADWSFRNEVELDVLVVVVVVSVIAILLQEKRKKRRRLHRLLWGSLMKRKDRKKFQRSRFADAIVDVALEMRGRGELHAHEEKEWYNFFATVADMKDLLPKRTRNPKHHIRRRLSLPHLYGLLHNSIPGKPEVTVDPTYKPNQTQPETTLARSRFRQPAE